MATDAQTRARRRYQREGTDATTVRWPKSDAIPARIRAAAKKRGIGPTTYIRRAIEAALLMDGYGPGSIPPEEAPEE